MPVVYPQYSPTPDGAQSPALDALRILGSASPSSGMKPNPNRLTEDDPWGTPKQTPPSEQPFNPQPQNLSPWQKLGQKVVDTSMEGLRGAIGGMIPGVGVPDTTAGHMGELAAAGAPLLGMAKLTEGPAVDALLKLLEEAAPQAADPLEALKAGKVSATPPTAPSIKLPAGLQGPETIARSPIAESALAQRQAALKPFQKATQPPVEAVQELAGLQDVKPQVPAPKSMPPLSGKYTDRQVVMRRTATTADDVKGIRDMADKGVSVGKIAAAYPHIKETALRDIINKNTFAWVK